MIRKALLLLAMLLAWQSARAGTDTAGVVPEDSAALELPAMEVKRKQRDSAGAKVKSDFIRKIPNTMNDPVRAVTFLPGVNVQSDLNIRPFIRGGDAEQTQVVMNGMSLLQPYHVGGVFSVFNMGILESVDLHRDDFPVEYPGALSGVLRLKTKSPSAAGAHVKTNVSLVRGDAFAEVPVLAGKLSVYGAAQSFLFNRSLHGLLDLSSHFSKDSLFQQDIQGYRDHINMPDFEDYHWGTSYLIREDLQANYSGSLALDDYAVVVPKQTNIIARPRSNNNGNPINVVPVIPKKEISRSKKLSIDSISSVRIHNQTHFLNVPWDVNSRNLVENDFGFQSLDWNVDFKKEAAAVDPLALSQSVQFLNYRWMDTYTPSRIHQFKFGWSYDYKRQNYQIELPYVLYDMIVNSNLDMLETLGHFSDDGFQIEKTDSTRSNFDYLGEYPSRIRFSHRGELEEHFGGLFYSHTLQTSSGSLAYGIRGEYQSTSREFFPAPRASYRWKVDGKNELAFNTGLYSQNNLPFFERDLNAGLKSEKSGQVGMQWSHQFKEGYRISLQNYYKRYFDLVSATLVPNGTIDLDGFLLPHPESPLSAAEIAQLQATLDTTRNFPALSDSIKELSYATFGGLVFDYRNTGIGNSLGSELSFFYNPNPIWNGWLSLDASMSNRRDAAGRPYYAYRYHRPLVFNWVNYFDFPGNYDISFTYRWALGQSYTPYTGTLDGKGTHDPISVGARNSGRLAPYSRLDIRLSRNARWGDTDFKAYLEVWNSMNNPNYFARDDHTGQLKSAQLNWPFPLLFLGVAWEM
jgi:hypothetical protein